MRDLIEEFFPVILLIGLAAFIVSAMVGVAILAPSHGECLQERVGDPVLTQE